MAKSASKTGERISDNTAKILRAILNTIVNTSIPNLNVTWMEDQRVINKDLKTWEYCTTTLSNTTMVVHSKFNAIDGVRSTHQDCREEESSLWNDNKTKCENWAEFVASLNPPATNAIPQPQRLSVTMKEQYLTENMEWFDAKQPEYLRLEELCNDAGEAYRGKPEQCNAHQSSFEVTHCAWGTALREMCATYTSCYSTAADAFGATKAAVQASEISRKTEY